VLTLKTDINNYILYNYAKTMYNNKVRVRQRDDKGPWLLSEETLLKIDEIMERAYDDFARIGEKSETSTYSNEIPVIKLTIWFMDEIEAEFKSFKEAIVSGSYSKLKPIRFEYKLSLRSNRVNLELNSSPSGFEYYINCDDDNIENNIIYEIHKIYSAEKPKTFFIITSAFGFSSFLLYFLILFIMATSKNPS
jgi:hypothetical protein